MASGRVAFIVELVRRDFAERFAGSLLGAAWVLIWPLVNLFVYIVIFGKMMGARLPGTSNMNAYGIYLAVGLIPWTCFSGTIGRSTSIFLEKKNIISKINISLPSLLLFTNISEIITCLVSALILALYLVSYGYEFNSRMLLLPFIFYLQQILAYTISLITASLTIYIRDVKEIVGVILQLWFWFTPIVYVAEILPKSAKILLQFNPAFILIESYQRIMVFNDYPEFRSLLIVTVGTHLLLLMAIYIFRKLERDIRDFL